MSKKTPRDLPSNEKPEPKFNGSSWVHALEPGETPEEYQARTATFTCPEGMQIVPSEPLEDVVAYPDPPMVLGKPSFESDLYAHIREWWMRQANEDVNLVIRKHGEYGDDSLATGGEALARLMGRPASRGRAQEIAIWHDLNVKLSRLENALRKGEEVGDDTWQDIACYAMMGRKAQQEGGWPYDKMEDISPDEWQARWRAS